MSEESRVSLIQDSQQEDRPEIEAADCEPLPFRCPVCGGDTLSYGVKSYQKTIIQTDGGWDVFGADSFGEDDVDFACWECGHVICVDGEPIRRFEDMGQWLKAHGAGEKG